MALAQPVPSLRLARGAPRPTAPTRLPAPQHACSPNTRSRPGHICSAGPKRASPHPRRCTVGAPCAASR
eukprot:6845214-Prymnesium_polylepis.1